jgi:glutaredoxin
MAKSISEMGKSAIPASSTHTRISDELAANEARFLQQQQERKANRLRLEQLQAQADDTTDLEDQERKELEDWMKENNDSRPIPLIKDDGSPSQIQTEEEEDNNPPQTEEDNEDSGKSRLRKDTQSDGDDVSVTDNVSEEAEEEQNEDEEEEEDDDNDDAPQSDEDDEVESDPDEPPTPKPKKKKSMPIKPLAKKRGAKNLVADLDLDAKPASSSTRSKTSKASVPAAKKPASSSAKATAASTRKRKTEEADASFDQQRPSQGLTTSLINMKEVFYMTREILLADMDGAARKFYTQAHRPQFQAPWRDLIENEAVYVIRDSLLQNKSTLGYTIRQCQGWPVIDGVPLSLRDMATDLKKVFFNDRATESTYDLDLALKN